jgi:hypothetical protein
MTPVGITATTSFLSTSMFRKRFQYSTTTERMAPSWMMISKLLRNSVSVRPSARLARIRCAVEEIGRNSVIPSTMPSRMAWSASSVG